MINSRSSEECWREGLATLLRHGSIAVLGAVMLAGCQPTVKIEAPDRPIEINLNVKIEHEIRVKVDRDLDDLLASNPELF